MTNKEIKKFPSTEEGVIIFKSYMHNYDRYMRIIVAIHHLQKVETMNNKDPSSFFFKFERMEDYEVFSQVACAYKATATLVGDGFIESFSENIDNTESDSESDSEQDKMQIDSVSEDAENKEITCYLIENPAYKTKTYTFVNADYSEPWLENIIPKMIDREKSKNMYCIHFLTLCDETTDKLLNALKLFNIKYKEKEFSVIYKNIPDYKVPIYTITFSLS